MGLSLKNNLIMIFGSKFFAWIWMSPYLGIIGMIEFVSNAAIWGGEGNTRMVFVVVVTK